MEKWDKTQTEGRDCDSWVIEYSLDFFFFGTKMQMDFEMRGDSDIETTRAPILYCIVNDEISIPS